MTCVGIVPARTASHGPTSGARRALAPAPIVCAVATPTTTVLGIQAAACVIVLLRGS
ncbi:hypothetical protein HMPREF1979_01842 [Actinomyces johnsonii F0542]|uniref:Uncharacterized protein n=1 Tax=Actinomyces johnsonii F0542 TaxID=1321818 RepID=U1QNU2_9ACTO|nr:hypothetical protein HMPREF1979_01842 [Actinomyces johnsonii F0542]